RIGTYELCSHIQEYCQLVPDRPVTAANPEVALAQDSLVDPNLCEEAVRARQVWVLDEIREADLGSEYLYTDRLPGNAAVIDLRPEAEFREWHYPASEHCEWADMLRGYHRRPKDRTYVLCCPHGLQSAVLAEKMQAKGYE